MLPFLLFSDPETLLRIQAHVPFLHLEEGIPCSSRYFATVRREIWIPIPSNLLHRASSDSGAAGSSAAISSTSLRLMTAADTAPDRPPEAYPDVNSDLRLTAVSYTHLDVYKRQGLFSIGDTITVPGKKFKYSGIPTFEPEHFMRVSPKNTMKRKQFIKGTEQIAQEGAIQIFKVPDSGLEEVIVGVVGTLQFDVFEYRMKNEYGVELYTCLLYTSRCV